MFKIDVGPTKSSIHSSTFPSLVSLQAIQGEKMDLPNNSCLDEGINDDEIVVVEYAEQVVQLHLYRPQGDRIVLPLNLLYK